MKVRILFGLALTLILMLTVANACKSDLESESDKKMILVADTTNTEDETDTDAPVDSSPKEAVGRVELGTIVGASVRIETRPGDFLFRTQTDQEGKYKINLEEIERRIKEIEKQKGTTVNFVHIVATGGTDINPNDDETIEDGEAIKVQGSVSAVVPLTVLKGGGQINVNLLTTYIDEMLVDVGQISDGLLDEAAETLQTGDSNGDGIVDYKDAISYRMAENESLAEANLRAEVLDYIHQGEKDKLKTAVREKRKRKTFLRVVGRRQGDRMSVWINGIGKSSTVRHAMNKIDPEQLVDRYDRQSFLLKKGDFLGYRECFSDGTCSQPFVHYFEGQNSYGYFPEYIMESKETLERKLQEARKRREAVRTRRAELASQIKALKSELAMLNAIKL